MRAARPVLGVVLRQIEARYQGFPLRPNPSRPSFHLSVAFEPVLPGWFMEQVAVRSGPARIDAWRWNFGFSLTEHSDHGNPSWRGRAWCAASETTFDTLLRTLWSAVLLRLGGCLLHACGLVRGDSAFVFAGASGAGKSTLAVKVDRVESLLSDDLVAVRRFPDGTWRAYATPFWGEGKWGRGSTAGHPLRAVGFLKQASRTTVRGISTAEAATRLLATMVSFQADRLSMNRTLDLIDQLSHEVRCTEVRLSKTTSHPELFRALGARR